VGILVVQVFALVLGQRDENERGCIEEIKRTCGQVLVKNKTVNNKEECFI